MRRISIKRFVLLAPAVGLCLALGLAGCGDSGPQQIPDGEGHVSYHFQGRAYRIADQAGASPVDISSALDPFELAAGEDGAASLSADGEWLVISSERFHADCAGWACLVRVPADLSAAEPILAAGSAVHPEGFYAIGSAGAVVIYAGSDGPHDLDLFAVRYEGGSWSAPQILTAASNHAFHGFPAVDPNASRVVFNCGPESFGDTGLCEVGTDGSGFRELLLPSHVPPSMPGPAVALHHPHYAPDGSVVFEGDWDGERIWRLPARAAEPEILSEVFTNDNSPCVLPSGRVASLWLNRPENTEGVHELKIMAADGSSHDMRVTGIEIDDWGLGCGL
jgi:hypothetical protein